MSLLSWAVLNEYITWRLFIIKIQVLRIFRRYCWNRAVQKTITKFLPTSPESTRRRCKSAPTRTTLTTTTTAAARTWSTSSRCAGNKMPAFKLRSLLQMKVYFFQACTGLLEPFIAKGSTVKALTSNDFRLASTHFSTLFYITCHLLKPRGLTIWDWTQVFL